jgi:prephenate dehydrogenase
MDIRKTRVLIAGLGLIGGSIAKALKDYGFEDVNGYDNNLSTLEKAKEEGVISEAFTRLDGYMEKFDFVLCCLSPIYVIPLYKEVAYLMKRDGVFAEVGGIKTVMIGQLNDAMEKSHQLLSLHPMAGSEKTGYNYSKGDMFHGSTLLVTPSDRTLDKAKMWVDVLQDVMGCERVVELSAKAHDEMIAHVSPVPHVVALALKAMYPQSNNAQFAGGSYKSATRVADVNAALWAGLMSDNRESLIESIGEFKKQLGRLEEQIQSGNREQLEKLLVEMSGKAKE